MEGNENNKVLRFISIAAHDLAAIIAIVIMFHTGRNNKSIILVAMFFFWVTSPFLALLVAFFKPANWQQRTRFKLYIMMIINALISTLAYSGVINPTGAKPAAAFLIMPLISWITIVIFVLANKKSLQSR